MKIYTSYYAKINKLMEQGYTNFVSIAGKTPDFYKFKVYKKLAPKYYWWKIWHDEGKSDEWYVERYYETVLNLLDPKEVINEIGDNAILLCYEKSDKFCHRHIVAEWLKNKLGIEVTEI